MSRKAFTLVELLVVVVVIALLVAMLLPALQKARAVVHQVTCLSNLRQTGTALLVMSDDFKGFVDGTYTGARWRTAITRYIPTDSFVKSIGISQSSPACPTLRVYGGTTTFQYGMNTAFLTPTGEGLGPGWSSPLHRFHDVRLTSRTFLASESSSTASYTPTLITTAVTGIAGYYTPRHETRGLNFQFIDGHGQFLLTNATTNQADWNQTVAMPLSEYNKWCSYGGFVVYGVENH